MMAVFVSLLLTIRSSVRSRAALQIEVLALRHQLRVFERTRPRRLRLTRSDRLLWVWLSRAWTDWREALVIVKPDTVIAWHRHGFRLFWTWKSRRRTGRPTVPTDVRTLIRAMSVENPLWGARRIHGELLKLGVAVSQTSVAKYMVRRRHSPSQRWRTFLANHIDQIMAAYFFVVPTATYRLLFVLVILAHERQRIVHVAVTDHPMAAWTLQQLRDAFPWDEAPRYLIHDRDHAFDGAMATMEIQQILTAPRSPWQNAYVERFIGSVRRECLGHVIVLNAAGLRRVLTGYVDYYTRSRTHLALEKDTPASRPSGCPTGCWTHRGDSAGQRPPPSLRTSSRIAHRHSTPLVAQTAEPRGARRRLVSRHLVVPPSLTVTPERVSGGHLETRPTPRKSIFQQAQDPFDTEIAAGSSSDGIFAEHSASAFSDCIVDVQLALHSYRSDSPVRSECGGQFFFLPCSSTTSERVPGGRT